MPLEELLRALEAETETAARALLDQAQRSARATVEEAEAAARALAAAGLEREEAGWREAMERGLAACRREGRRQWLEARQAVLNRIFALAALRLPGAAASPENGAAIPAELDLALAFLGDSPCVVHCPPAHAGATRQYLANRPEIRVQPDTPGGLRIVACDGSVEVDRTLERRLGSLRRTLSMALMQRLESGCDRPGTTSSPA